MIVEVDVTVDRPAELVFDAMADARNEPTWNSQVTRGELLSEPPIGPGSRFETVNRGQTYVATITEYQRPDKLTFEVSGRAMSIVGQMTFAERTGSTTLKARFSLQPHGVMRAMLPLMAGTVRRDFPEQMASFKAFVEGDPEGQETNGAR